jgi:UDP-N-acetylmuramate--alanine ligase
VRKFKLHFVGLGGIGMSGIAEVFLTQGHEVSGSDLNANEITERLVQMGARFEQKHARENVRDADVVVISSAVKADNPEVVEARSRGIPVIPRAEMLAEIMRGKTGIAIAGTHGKTTTTSMCAQILIKAGMDPTVVVGGKVESIGSNAKVGASDFVVVEADESDGSFQLLPATHTVITNIDLDHMEHYGTRANLDAAFIKFAKKIPFYGCNWLCGDDEGVQAVLPQITKPFFTYGFSKTNDLYATNVLVHARGVQSFEVWKREGRQEKHRFLGMIELKVLGKHNVLNAMAAMGVAMSLGATFEAAKEALQGFRHVRRRFDERFYDREKNIRVIDDYGHHPTEVRAVLSTARQTGHARIVTVFQPHRYTRTQLCWNDFLTCFQDTDVLLMLPIYSAGEESIPGVSTTELVSQIRSSASGLQVIEVASLEDAEHWVQKNSTQGDLILTLGAGSITRLAGKLSESLQAIKA